MKKVGIAIAMLVFVTVCLSVGIQPNKTYHCDPANSSIVIEPNDDPGPGIYVGAMSYEVNFVPELSLDRIISDNAALDEALDAIYEAAYRREFVERFSKSNALLADFLQSMGALDEFVSTEDSELAVTEAASAFSQDKELRSNALVRAKELYADVHIDSNWKALREFSAKPTQIPPVEPELASDTPGKHWDASGI